MRSYKEYLTKSIASAIEQHAMARYPLEACGFITDDGYIPCANIHNDPCGSFAVADEDYIKYEDSIKGIVHSHPYTEIINVYDRLAPSKNDMQAQIATNLPWFIIATDGNSCSEIVGFGDCLQPEALKGRTFIHGIWDCYSLVRDYFRMEKSIILPEFPRSDDWWNHGENMYEDNFKKAGFIEIMPEQAKAGDAILYNILSACCNHAAIYLGDGEILHHLHGRKSSIDNHNLYFRRAQKVLRYAH